ncbi:MAG: NAD(P)H-binding protein [Acidimicrobiia bacterium]|nr:MAG: NAD(P)H-binding protein [Acidimicrobiia bacterium]
MRETYEVPTRPILVLGANGKTGRRVAERLAANGLPVRGVSRSTDPRFDWEDPETWGQVLSGVRSAYITFQPDLAVPGAGEAIRTFTSLAASSGVDRLVLLSGRGEPEAQACEQIVQDAGIDWTIVRSSWFSQNWSESFLLGPILSGHVAMPAGEIPEPFTDADDIADVAVAALTQDGHKGQIYELTGPHMLTFAEAVAEISIATGREIQYHQVSLEQYLEGLSDHGVSADFIGLLEYLFTTVLDGRNAQLTNGVRRALGRDSKSFAEFAVETAATGIWDTPDEGSSP